jgi:hypothetical protein
VVHRTVNTVDGELVVSEVIECVQVCSDPPPRSEPTRVGSERRKSNLPEVKCEWASLPDIALPEHRAKFPIHNLNGEKIATGYTSILVFTDDLMFLECAESQVVETMFKPVVGESDRYGGWVHMQTPSGFYGRKYLKIDGDMLAGFWYFRLNLEFRGRCALSSIKADLCTRHIF